MSDTSFVRTEMLPEVAPPTATGGALGWLRENLFYSVASSVATLVTMGMLGWLGWSLLMWLAVPTWAAGSLGDCRSIIAELGRDGHGGGACWGVIRERSMQLLFGFYPKHLYWRPVLALLLLAPALAPVLFSDKVPGRLLWVTLAYPFVMPWLLWGGSLWLPIGAALGFVIGYLALRAVRAPLGDLAAGFIALAAALIWWLVLLIPALSVLTSVLPLELETVQSRKFGGFTLSLTIGLVAIGLSLPLGILLALGRRSKLLLIKSLCVAFIELIRGVPLITLLFVASTLLNIFLPPGTEFDIIMRVIIMATLFASAYMAEVIRGGLAALPSGQYEAADSLGLDYWKSMRLIIMPQALKVSIPGVVSRFIALFKDTTLVSIIGLLDPLGFTTAIRANQEWAGIVWELYGFIAVLFFIVTFSMSRYSLHLERKLHRGH